MKKILSFGLFFLIGILGFDACATTDNTNSGTNRNTANNMARATASPIPAMETANTNRPAMGDDVDFMATAGTAGVNEIELSKLAQTRAQSPEVKKFAAMMVTDHTRAGNELNALGKKKDVKPATEMDSSHKTIAEKLKGLSGADFDKAYVDAMVDDHEDAVDLFKSQSESGKDAEVKAFAAKTLPTLQNHLKTINEIKAKMK